MKKLYPLIFFSLYSILAFSQSGTWTWISGESVTNAAGVYGTQGVPSINNHPPTLYEYAEWKDKQGNFWIYGGSDKDVAFYSDLWMFNPSTKEWTWVKGNGLTNQSPYGMMGVSSPLYSPGGRDMAIATWVDTSGMLWLYGGDSGSDLWKYDISSNAWTWVTGSVFSGLPVYGIQGIPSAANSPGRRYETSSAWTDIYNHLWLFGGWGNSKSGGGIALKNDLFRYNISTNEWTWMKGSDTTNTPVNYGIKGIPDINNDPGARWTYSKWKDARGNFWLIGGSGSAGSSPTLNDVWKYDLSTNVWIWESGTSRANDTGSYVSVCSFDTLNIPYSRYEHRSSVIDSCGRFWLFGGRNYAMNAFFNDLWAFDPYSLKWDCVKGTNMPNQTGNYGTKGVSSPLNMPPCRCGADAWWGNDNKFYLFGGRRDISPPYTRLCYADMWVYTPDTNCTGFCTAIPAPPAVDFQTDKTDICANDCITFNDLSTNATSWQWAFSGGMPSSSTDQNPQVCYLTPGIYSVTLVASNSAGNNMLSVNNYITVNTLPPTPNVLDLPGIGNDTLIFSKDQTYLSYQWYFDSTLIAGATDTFLVVTQNGNYNVEVTNANGCKTAVGINVIIGVQNYMKDNFVLLSPNPATNKLSVNSYSILGKGALNIYNTLGEVCFQSEIKNPQSEIDISGLAPGIYFVQLIGEKERWVGRFVKE